MSLFGSSLISRFAVGLARRGSRAVAFAPKLALLVFPLVLIASIAWTAEVEEDYRDLRDKMVENQLLARGIKNERVLKAMRNVLRHLFVPPGLEAHAYEDKPLPIGRGQTISQPYIVALMTELLRPESGDTILEIGTGSGYQAAVLSQLVREVYSIEIVPGLASEAAQRLGRLGFSNVEVRTGDGYKGWPEHAPFDGVLVTAAPPEIPTALVAQLKRGGRMVVPVGKPGKMQNLLLLEKSTTSDEIVGRRVIPVQFVPMINDPSEAPGTAPSGNGATSR
jgi:protein-L-isoaspartate(D-aspartate) O-methyltransferase